MTELIESCWRPRKCRLAFSAGGDGGRKPVRSRIANAKRIGWAIYAAGFAIWLFGYLSAGHAPLFDWDAATPWWISTFVPNLEAELGLALTFASMIPTLPWVRLFPFAALLVFAAVTLAWWGVLVANLACNLGTVARVTMRRPWVAMASFVAVLLVLALGHRWSVTASWLTSDKTCGERHGTPWFAERLDIDCGRLLRE